VRALKYRVWPEPWFVRAKKRIFSEFREEILQRPGFREIPQRAALVRSLLEHLSEVDEDEEDWEELLEGVHHLNEAIEDLRKETLRLEQVLKLRAEAEQEVEGLPFQRLLRELPQNTARLEGRLRAIQIAPLFRGQGQGPQERRPPGSRLLSWSWKDGSLWWAEKGDCGYANPQEVTEGAKRIQELNQEVWELRERTATLEGIYRIMEAHLSPKSRAQVEGGDVTINPSSGRNPIGPSPATEGTFTDNPPTPENEGVRPVKRISFPALRALVALPIVEKLYVSSIGLALTTAALFCFFAVLPPRPNQNKILLAMVATTTVVGLVGKALDFLRGRKKIATKAS
jgi:hypothetical protein